jgi:hypothetical protein
MRARFASHEYLGADALYYYFIVPVYPNSLMPEGLLLLFLGKLCKQQGWRVVLDESENGVRPTLKLQIGVEGSDDDDTLLTLPDISLVSKSELAEMPLFAVAEAKQILMAAKSAIDAACNSAQLMPYSLTESAYKF